MKKLKSNLRRKLNQTKTKARESVSNTIPIQFQSDLNAESKSPFFIEGLFGAPESIVNGFRDPSDTIGP